MKETKDQGTHDSLQKNVRGRPFEPGNKMGRGRPKGSRNKPKPEPPGQQLLNEYGEHVMRKCISLALQGKMAAMRLVLERTIPSRRGATVRLGLPRIKTVTDVAKAADEITRQMLRGKLTLTEGSQLTATMESRSRILEKLPPAPLPEPEARDPQLDKLTDDELAQLIALTEKMQAP
jgi:hypothetical protein